MFGKLFKTTFLFIFLAELFSIFGYLLPDFNKIAFAAILILALFLSLYRLEYGILILLTELFIGSKGYLFFFEYSGMVISLRIGLWLIVIAVWLGKEITALIKKYPQPIKNSQYFNFFRKHYFFYFFILFIFMAWGLVNGFLARNSFNNIFFDFNGWLYFALIFPIYSIFARSNQQKILADIFQIFAASIVWLSAKTFFLLFAFSHNMIGMTSELYRWVRISGVGEITKMESGGYRIFFQSHIFVLIGLFVFLLLLTKLSTEKYKNINKKFFIFYFSLFVIFFSVNLINFSRSNWIGLIAGLLFCGFIIAGIYGWKTLFCSGMMLLFSFILSVGLITATIKFPYPSPINGFNAAESLVKRAKNIENEAGVSSRWSLLPKLWEEIEKAPILGQGFGATVAYKSMDPRVLKTSADSVYSTYAFEWGWLDIWLKLGFLGLLAYLALISKIIINCFCKLKLISRQNTNKLDFFNLGLIAGLIAISIVSFFSPYMNHPLGIGYLIIVSAVLGTATKDSF